MISIIRTRGLPLFSRNRFIPESLRLEKILKIQSNCHHLVQPSGVKVLLDEDHHDQHPLAKIHELLQTKEPPCFLHFSSAVQPQLGRVSVGHLPFPKAPAAEEETKSLYRGFKPRCHQLSFLSVKGLEHGLMGSRRGNGMVQSGAEEV